MKFNSCDQCGADIDTGSKTWISLSQAGLWYRIVCGKECLHELLKAKGLGPVPQEP